MPSLIKVTVIRYLDAEGRCGLRNSMHQENSPCAFTRNRPPANPTLRA
jgi:hypothetical protein